MQTLFPTVRTRLRRPASQFPERADVYFCDYCGRDITRHLHRPRTHCWRPVGPQRYRCRCGQAWLSGMLEWDHFDARERKRRVHDLCWFAAVHSLLASLVAALVWWALVVTGSHRLALRVAMAIAATPALLILVPFAVEIAASIWRTRHPFRTASR